MRSGAAALAVAVVVSVLASADRVASAEGHAESDASTAPRAPARIERVSLRDAVERALARNATVVIAAAEIERADALIEQARAGWFPILNANGNYTRLDHDRVLNDRKIASANQLSANLQLTIPLIAAPAWANTRRANSGRRVAEASAADVRRQIAQATARAYLTVIAQRRLLAAVESSRSTAKAHYDFAHTRLEGGIGRSIDDVRAAQDLATVEAQLQASLVALTRAREALGVLVGSDGPLDAAEDAAEDAPEDAAKGAKDGATLPGASASFDQGLSQAVKEASARRADLRLLDRRVAAAQRASDDRWAYYAPYLAAVGQPFVQHPATLLQPATGWQAQLVLTLPIYDGGLRGGVAHEREVVLKEARANLEAGIRQAASEVRIAFEAMLRTDQALSAAREAARLAQRAQDLAMTAYRAGATTNLEVIDAARRARDADIAAAQAEDQSRQARLDLMVASGRWP